MQTEEETQENNQDRQHKDLVIVHGKCFDGVSAGYVASTTLDPFPDFYYGNPSKPDEMITFIETTPKYRNLYFFDLAFRGQDLEKILSLYPNAEIYDHHLSGYNDISKHYQDKLPENYHFDNNISGVNLAWQWKQKRNNTTESLPTLLAYIQDGDLWKFELENSKQVTTGLYSQVHLNRESFQSEEDNQKLFETWHSQVNDPQFIENCKSLGEILIREKDREIRSLIYRAKVIKIGEHRVYFVNNTSSKLTSDLGNQLVLIKDQDDNYKCDYSMMWAYDTNSNEYRVSLRSRREEDQGVNVGEVAKSLSQTGGGHYSAAGFATPDLWKTLGLTLN